MTLQSFYKVIEVTAKTIRLRKLAKREWSPGQNVELCEPQKDKGAYILDKQNPEPFRVKVNKDGDYRVPQEGTLRVWDGQPLSQNTYD